MKLITELTDEVSCLVEANEAGEKSHFISGTFAQANLKNRNGRIYPRNVLESQVEAYQDQIKRKTALSELNHPSGPQIDLGRVSHLITELKFDGDNVIGKAKVLSTPCGNIVKNLIDDGAHFGVSTRGLGSVKMNKQGLNEVQSDFRLAAIDVVSQPSGIDCWVNGIMEGVEWLYDEKLGWKVVDLAEQSKAHIEAATRSRSLQEQQIKLFENFMKKISNIL